MAYSSKSLGKHERFHRTMAASIRCLLLDLKDLNAEWDTVLPMVEYAFRSSVCAETHLSPMDVWLGRETRQPVDLSINVGEAPTPATLGSPEAYVQGIRKRLELMYAIQANQEAASREKMIEKYKQRARPAQFSKGESVYVNEPDLRDE